MAVPRAAWVLVLPVAFLAGCGGPDGAGPPLDFPDDCDPPVAAWWSEPGMYRQVVAAGGPVGPRSGTLVAVPALAGLNATFEHVAFEGANGSAALGLRSGIFSAYAWGADPTTLKVLVRDFLRSATTASDADIAAWLDGAQATGGELYTAVPEDVPLRVDQIFQSATLRVDSPPDLGKRALQFGPWTLSVALPQSYLEREPVVVFVDEGDAVRLEHGSAPDHATAIESGKATLDQAGLPTAHIGEARPLQIFCL